MPFFSTVTPVYNRANLIRPTLDSILKQSFEDFEVILVDDGSDDHTVDVIRGYDDDRIRLIEQENAGPGAARNTGVEAARGEYVAFLDSDDLWFLWTPDTCEKVIRNHYFPAFIAGQLHRFRDPVSLQ